MIDEMIKLMIRYVSIITTGVSALPALHNLMN